ncbi:ATP-dependent DNA helicase RecG [uncultured Gemella sp.]|uniref:ATP-dependent DNA helicase RecG n=1 Tax=uncultured Gemella sp. TaxID=254352 RepID=UPI0028D3FCE5|nr:ATP-dependent DNA helicase RecG [uncultured Gemella sp.]
MINILEKSVGTIKGVGKKYLQTLNELEIYTIRDVLYNIPYRVSSSTDFSSSVKDNEKVITTGRIETRVSTQFYGNRRSRSFFTLSTSSGSIKIVFFNQHYLKKNLIEGRDVVVKGTYNATNNTITASSISFNSVEENPKGDTIEVFYHLKQGITQKKFIKLVEESFKMIDGENVILDLVPENFKGIWKLEKILFTLHYPKNPEEFDKARKMFAFHELFNYQLKLQLQNINSRIEDERYNIGIDNFYVEEFKNSLPFKLTGAQSRVIEEIVKDLNEPYKMDRLLQGDVGSGKTAVAAATLYSVIKAGYQTAIMAPTEILANQHFETFFEFFKDLNISVALLTSSTPKKERNTILSLLEVGEIELLIGTHSLIQEDVKFKNLKYVITDEQHRFGVKQRQLLSNKGEAVNSLMMTATPIPRSLAITLITDIKVSTIDELPAGRKKVQTYKANNKSFYKVLDNIRMELDNGRQGYVVCPLIEESEKMDLQNVEETYENIKNYLPKDYKIAILHGKMSNKEKDAIVEKFLNKEIHILISTTVIEVGVNVPNATFMIIVDAHRFGLATLHQLRGRVGRSEFQSYCILVTDSKSERIDIMCLENDGFKIAEFDLKQRGPGDFFGTKQSGVPSFKVADLINDVDLMYLAKRLAVKIIEVTDNKERLLQYVGLEETII